jgi:uncharacterized protein (TIGR02246 family)
MTSTATTDVSSGIEAGNRRFMSAVERGDAAALAALYSQQAILLPPHSDFVSGGDAIRQFWQQVLELGIKQVALETLEVQDYGDTAHEVGRYTLRMGDGQPVDSGKYLVVWRREGGTWKLHRDVWNTSRPAA